MQGIWGKLSTEQKVIAAVLGVVAIVAIFLAISNSSRQKAAQEAAQLQQQQAPVAQQQQVEFFSIGGFQNEALGTVVLGDKDGRTLYTFANDATGVSNCSDQCTVTWPPFVFADPKQFLVPPTIAQSFDTFERADGKGHQVTYQGRPLYYYSGDAGLGDAKGEGLNNGAWKVVTIQQAPTPTAGAATNQAPQQ